MNKEKISLEVYLLPIAIVVAAIIGAVISGLPKHFRLSRYGVETQGVVTAKERESHMHILVEYAVNNQKFKLVGSAGSIDKEFDLVQINERVPVYYDSLAPESASLGKPSKHLQSSLIGTGVISLIPLILFISYKLKKISKESNYQR